MAPHRPAPSVVAEDGKARRVLARPGRLGASSFDNPALLPARPGIEELPPYVAADEGVEVVGREHYTPRSSGPACGHNLAEVVERLAFDKGEELLRWWGLRKALPKRLLKGRCQ